MTANEDLATDLIWYAWSGPFSPLFGKSKMATFERYFLTEPHTHVEKSNPYYHLRDEEWFSEKILAEFDAKEEGSAIINGHTPVKVKKESHRSKQTEKHLLLTEVYPKLIKKQPGLLATHYYAILTVSKS